MESTLLDQEAPSFVSQDGSHLFGLDPRLTKALKKIDITRPTLIQAKAIPLFLEGKDVLVRSKTGSGKTFAFLLPVVHKILAKQDSSAVRKTSAILLVPTKELCDQTEANLKKLLHYCSEAISIASLANGSKEVQKAHLDLVPDVIVTTPGRLVEHLKDDPQLFKNQIDSLVVDECDLVISYGGEHDVKTICSRISRACQGIMLSATLDEDVSSLKRIVLNDPVTIKLQDGEEGNLALKQWYIAMKREDRDLIIFGLIKLKLVQGKTLFFVNSVDQGYRLKLFMEQFGAKSAVLNAELPYNSRRHIIESYEKGMFDFVIATDDAVHQEGEDDEFGVARGVDFQGVLNVINVEMPATVEAYTHRVGRTARAGASGTAISLVVQNQDEKLLMEIQETQPKRNGEDQPISLALDVGELDGLRYRVEGMSNSIKKKAIKNARLKDLKNEMLNAQTLQAHFQDNPQDLQLLKHDAPLKSAPIQKHLRTVPNYLLPGGFVEEQRMNLVTERNKEDDYTTAFMTNRYKKRNKNNQNKSKKRRKKDPLF